MKVEIKEPKSKFPILVKANTEAVLLVTQTFAEDDVTKHTGYTGVYVTGPRAGTSFGKLTDLFSKNSFYQIMPNGTKLILTQEK